jgi:phosphoserine phosphatase RsbU/P
MGMPAKAPCGNRVDMDAMKLLIAEDDRTMRTVLRRTIERWGYDVVEANDGEAAWTTLSSPEPPRIAVLDWIMPGLDGIDVCRRLATRENAPLVYVIILTSKSEKADIVTGLDSGAHDFLSKPVDPAELRSRIAVGERLIRSEDALRQAMAQINTLHGLLPICAQCKKIREDAGYWTAIESYVSRHSQAVFSHGICPACAHALYPELYEEEQKAD